MLTRLVIYCGVLLALLVVGATYPRIVGWGLALTVAGVLYFAPAINARIRNHRQRSAIAALNVMLGWTFLGWVIALVWSYTSPR